MIHSPSPLASRIRQTIRRDPISWAYACKVNLRPYQREIALAIKDSIIHHRGLTFVVILPRQSGKNELQAHLFAWLLFRYSNTGGNIVSISPTFNPQTINNMGRVRRSLDACVGSRGLWKSSQGRIYALKNARLLFYSGETSAKVVGATADLLLSVDEAQDVSPAKFDKEFDPMTASTNATRILFGTAWTANTLLERERRLALQAEKQDGVKRVFHYTADQVCLHVPAYKDYLNRKIAEHGRNHPIVRSQFFGETIEAQSGMFNPARLALMIADSPLHKSAGFGEGPGVGSHDSPPRGGEREGGRACAFLIDVAGMDESKTDPLISYDTGLGNPGRDSTALTIVEIDLSTLETLERPTYHVIARHPWVGDNHVVVFNHIKNLAETFNPQHIVIDATGVGEGLWAMLDRRFPARVIPVKFTQPEKSDIGWRFLNIIETGRFRDHCHTDQVRLQYSHCLSEILPGPQKILRWGVPAGTRGPAGEPIHDDFVVADSLVAKLDELDWYISFSTIIIPQPDVLDEMDGQY